MKITFENVVPAPLAGAVHDSESIWGKNISFSSPDVVLVRAASGKGKSTLLSLLYGLRNDYSGKIIVEGKDVRANTLNDWTRLRQHSLSMMFQDLRLFGDLTAMQNIRLKASLAGNTSEEEITDMARALGVEEKLGARCKYLSLGQQQRVALIRCLVQPFSFLLLDEPFSHIDKANQEKAKDLIMKTCAKNSAGLILTSLDELYDMKFNVTLAV